MRALISRLAFAVACLTATVPGSDASAQQIDFTQVPPAQFSGSSYEIRIYMEGVYGSEGCGSGWYCDWYDYSVQPGSFAFSTNDTDRTSAFQINYNTRYECFYGNPYPDDQTCYEGHTAIGTPQLFAGAANTLRTQVNYNGNYLLSDIYSYSPAPTYGVTIDPVLRNFSTPARGTGTAAFDVTNTGNQHVTFNTQLTCTGYLQCSYVLGAGFAPGETRRLSYAYTVAGDGGSTGRITLRLYGAGEDTDYADGTVPVVRGVSVIPDGQAANGTAAQAGQLALTVINSGNVRDTFALTASCAGTWMRSGTCQPTGPTVALGNNGSSQVGVNFTGADAGGTGTLALRAVRQSDPSVADSGYLAMTVAPPPVQVTIVPDEQIAPAVLGSNTYVFSVANTSAVPAPLSFQISCGWNGTATCDTPPDDRTVPAYTTVDVQVAFQMHVLDVSEWVTLTALASDGRLLDQGSIRVTAFPRRGVAVAFVDKQSNAVRFRVTNTGDIPATYQFTRTCEPDGSSGGGIQSCAPAPAPLSLSAGLNGLVSVSYERRPMGGPATVTLTATDSEDASITQSASHSFTIEQLPTPAPPPTVAVSPENAALLTANTLLVTFGICSEEEHPDDPAQRQVTLNEQDVSGVFSPVPGAIKDGCEIYEEFQGAVPLSRGANQFKVDLVTFLGYSGLGGVATFYRPLASRSVTVRSATSAPFLENGASGRQHFVVRNTGDTATTYGLTATCTGAAAAPCGLSVSQTQLGPNQSATVEVTFPAQGDVGTRGVVSLVAADLEGAASDSAWADLVIRAAKPVLEVAMPTDGTLEKSQCLVFALAPDVARECDALRITHALPAVTTLGQTRAPTLVYYDEQVLANYMIPINVTLPSAVGLPDTVKATLQYAGSDGSWYTWTSRRYHGSKFAGGTKRIGLFWDDGLPFRSNSRIQRFRVLLETYRDGVWSSAASPVEVDMPLVRRWLAPGWHVAGVEELYPGQYGGRILWVGGNGSTRVYALHAEVGGTRVYRTTNVTRPDTLYQEIATGAFERRPAPGLRVKFDAVGRHVQTVNRLGHVTMMSYVGSTRRIETLTVPPGAAGHVYRFHYTPAGFLDSISAPGATAGVPRVVDVRYDADAVGVDQIRDPDGHAVNFELSWDWPASRYLARTDRRDAVQSFTYESWAVASLQQASMQADDSTVVRHTFRGTRLPGGLSSLTPVPLDSVYVRYDGPRVDVDDTYRFWVNAFGAPERILDPVGRTTRVERGDTRFPGLATVSYGPNGLPSSAFYNARGLVDSVTVHDPLGTSADATTRYAWHPTWNTPTAVTSPTNALTEVGIDATTGNTTWQQTGGPTRRVDFRYVASGLTAGLLEEVDGPLTAPQQLAYDELGNLRRSRSPAGRLAFVFRDRLGRDTLSVSPVAEADARDSVLIRQNGSWTRTTYDVMDQVRATKSWGAGLTVPAAPSGTRTINADSVWTEQEYDPEGRVTEILRKYTLAGATTPTLLQTSYRYDSAGRLREHIASGATGTEQHQYDAAGNLIWSQSARGDMIRVSYDELNRVVRRVLPQVAYEAQSCGYFAIYTAGCTFQFPTIESSVCVRADTASFGYDQAGNMTRADNYAARIRRSYYPNGQVKEEAQAIRTYHSPWADQPCDAGPPPTGGPPPNGEFGRHVYVLGFEYDLDGRRTKLLHPTSLASSSQREQSYRYTPATGELEGVTDRFANEATFEYDFEGRLRFVRWPGGPSEETRYDADSRVEQRLVSAFGTDVFTRDATGRVRSASVGGGTAAARTVQLWYGPLGAVVASQNVTWSLEGGGFEEFATDALGNRLWQRQYMVRPNQPDQDGERTFAVVSGQLTGITSPPNDPQGFRVEQQLLHDASGNQGLTTGYRRDGEAHIDEHAASYYRADQKLAVHNTHIGNLELSNPGGVFEEYRYDALGRRVLVRSRSTALSATCGRPCSSYIERTVWDGDEALYEIRADGATAATYDALERDDPASTTPSAEPYGVVAYTHAPGTLGIDAPVFVRRSGLSNGEPVILAPHADWRGQYQGASLIGGSALPQIDWPGATVTVDGAPARPATVHTWMGSLLGQKTDGSGLQYMRNRYYDPKTGRFTQADPIGLAGGLNLYGFAGGDPVSYSDPFGLCPYEGTKRTTNIEDCPDDKRRDAFRLIRDYGGEVGQDIIGHVVANNVVFGLAGAGSLDCGGQSTTGCSDKATRYVRLNGDRSAAGIAGTIVHEVTHLGITYGTMSSGREELTSQNRGLDFYQGLPKKLRTDAAYNSRLLLRARDPDAWTRYWLTRKYSW